MRNNHFSMLPERAFQPRNGRSGMTLEGGGGGPQQTTTYTSNIPEYLRPQVEALIGGATQEYFTTKPRQIVDPQTGLSTTTYDITGVKPYVPYSRDPRDYVAPFSPGQQAVFREAAGMRTPEGFAGGTQLAAMGARGGLESAGQAYGYGQLGAGYGAMGAGMAPEAQFYGREAAGLAPEAQMYGRTGADIGLMGLRAERLGRDIGQEARGYARQAAGMGGLYEQMATDPRAMQAYMSPYQQNVTEIAKQQAIEDAQRTQLGANLGAARQGTYGGARQTLAQTQREAALGKQLSDIQAQGLQRAFEQAQQAQQFGITTGLQGLQGAQAGLGTALQGGQLGLSGIGQAIAGQQAGLQGLGQAGQLYGQGLAGLGQAGQLYGLGMQGAQVGLQGVQGAQAGYGLGIQGGQTVANIAAQQQEAELNRMRFQAEQAAMQQAQEQRIIDQAVQNYALAQEAPFQRLSQYSGLLRGYSTPTMTTESYRAGAPAASQLAGLAATAYGAAMPGRKKGGMIKEEGIDALAIKKAKRKEVAA